VGGRELLQFAHSHAANLGAAIAKNRRGGCRQDRARNPENEQQQWKQRRNERCEDARGWFGGLRWDEESE
jgi:hypothetical protein